MADQYDNPAEDSDVAGKDDLTRKLIGWYKRDLPHVQAWRKEAKEDFRFYANDQWSDEDRRVLDSERRPSMTFNRIAPLVNAITGSEINNRREVQYLPREQGDAMADELLTSAGEWFRDQSNAEDEESDMFEDAVIGGMGWVDTKLDFEENPDGDPKITRMDPFQMGWDCNSTKPNLEDARWLWCAAEKPLSEWQEMFPDVEPELLNASWAKTGDDNRDQPHDQTQADRYESDQDEDEDSAARKMCTVVEFRWIAKVPYYRGPDLETGQLREYDEKQIAIIRKMNPDFPAVRQFKKVIKRAFVGKMVLAEPDQPLTPPGLFGWECVTGYRDKIKNQFYGVVRAAKDPQRWSNKFFSQVMFLLNSQAKGGVMAERGAFEDDNAAELSWAKADAITYLAKGALGERPKIQEKPVAQFPAGFFTLFQESKEAISDVTGLSAEFIGTREVDQAGVLEYQRRQSSLNLLASLFNSLRRYRKRQGRVMLYLIQNYLSDGRLVRIVGDDRKQYVPLTKAQVANSKYDIIIDDAPTSPNEKERTWQILQGLLPLVKDLVTPEVMLDILPYTPLPPSFVEKLKKQAQAAASAPKPPTPEEAAAQSKLQLEQAKGQIDIAGKQADLQAHQAKTQADIQKSGIDLWIAQKEAETKIQSIQASNALLAQKLAIQAEANRIAAKNANSRQTRAASQ